MKNNVGKLQRFWTAVAERSGDTALERPSTVRKGRGASLPAALQIVCLLSVFFAFFAVK
ncbi:MAG TPA: hypothetical protein VG077_04365 [Verrucomicrobiae bacterium]|nr:hypothetical protein [Verrucomicrobiae bacterium]